MMLNKVILIGRLGKDPEVRYIPNGEAVCNFSVATSESWNDRNGQRQERVEWHNITMYRRLAEIAGQYLKKGSQVYLEGKIQTRKYQGKDGIERTAYDIIDNEMKMLGGSGNDGQQARQVQNGTPPAPPKRQAPAAPAAPVEDIDDDIPF
ncbi:MAG: single-stranded DNA-binding protein [Neisseria sp.]|nr:MAG: single-stranded DNA-binding protein [Neisseria sp.]